MIHEQVRDGRPRPLQVQRLLHRVPERRGRGLLVHVNTATGDHEGELLIVRLKHSTTLSVEHRGTIFFPLFSFCSIMETIKHLNSQANGGRDTHMLIQNKYG